MSQFNDPTLGNPPPKKKSILPMVLIILGIVVVLPTICCGVIGYMIYGGVNKAMGAAAEQMVAELKDAPAMKEHIGDIQSAQMNIMESTRRIEAAKKAGNDEPLFIVDVQGSKGKGKVILQNMQGQSYDSAILELPDGKTFPLKDAAAMDTPDVTPEMTPDTETDADADTDSNP